jgi:uncharacterized coiled-coil DUF342 family protein
MQLLYHYPILSFVNALISKQAELQQTRSQINQFHIELQRMVSERDAIVNDTREARYELEQVRIKINQSRPNEDQESVQQQLENANKRIAELERLLEDFRSDDVLPDFVPKKVKR